MITGPVWYLIQGLIAMDERNVSPERITAWWLNRYRTKIAL